ncbi:sporulation protein [Bacillus carboniphilus]|uniref:Sporulation protein n=1 Tax=Bacillus carboniphilus TaxID=86663 RepID=A0ABY9JVB0_9BACI|nr:sporulation protein [Bacillus carboniphilus]WLR43332.1 sporulation protein [Bacillus carboniphilus]
MSFFNKMLATIGIGSAKVDTKLKKGTLAQGEKIEGVVEITGGSIEQQIDEIYLTLITNYIKEVDDKKFTEHAVISKVKINEPFVITANETKSIPFSFMLPYDTPITIGKTRVWINTGLDIKGAVDPSDKDYVKVVPNPLMNAVLNSIEEIGFSLREIENEVASYRLRKRLPFVQEFEFYPTRGEFRGRLDELEVVFFQKNDREIDILMEIDRKARGLAGLLSEALETDETHIKLTVTSNDLDFLTEKISQIIRSYS